MNQRLVESVAQITLAMFAEERQLLESTLQRFSGSLQTVLTCIPLLLGAYLANMKS